MAEFSRKEIYVIKACKSHFAHLSESSNYEDAYKVAQRIIENMVYANEDNSTPIYTLIGYLREILLKTRRGLTAEGWEAITMQMIFEVENHARWKSDKPFLERFLARHFEAVQNIPIFVDGQTLIDLDITDGEQIEVQKALR